MKKIAIAALISLAASNAMAWTVRTSTDRMSDRVEKTLSIYGMNLTKGVVAVVAICENSKPSVGLLFAKPIGLSGTFGYRFDGKQGHRPDVRFMNTETAFFSSHEDSERFLSEAAGASSLYIQMSTNHDFIDVDFDLNRKGYAESLQEFRDHCASS